MYRVPEWCRPPASLIGREQVLQKALEAVVDEPITLVGPPGVGTTCLGGALLEKLIQQDLAWQFSAVRLDRCTRLSDVIRVIGRDIDALLPGDQPSLASALRGEHRTAILLDDADLAPELAKEALDLGPSCLWIATGRREVFGTTIPVERFAADELTPLLPEGADPTLYLGLPLLACLPGTPSAEDTWAAVRTLPRASRYLADLAMGLPDRGADIPDALRLPVEGRVVLRRSVREAIGANDPPSPEALTAAIRDRVPVLRELAADGPGYGAPEDLVLLRVAANRVVDPELRALASAAAARLAIRSFQASEALSLLEAAQGQRLSKAMRGLLKWVEGDALLDQGAEQQAAEAHQSAAGIFHDSLHATALAGLARRCAEQCIARGAPTRARHWLGLARSALGTDTDRSTLADILRISGDLAAHAGELVGAEALYDEAEATLSRLDGAPGERASVHLGRTALALARGEYAPAAEQLDEAEKHAPPRGLLAAAIAYRRAQISMRLGEYEESRNHVLTAQREYKLSGSLRGLALCSRLRGDIAAVRGDYLGARMAYDQAIALCVRTRDLASLHRTLRRLVAIEREGMPGPHVDELQEVLDIAEVLAKAEK